MTRTRLLKQALFFCLISLAVGCSNEETAKPDGEGDDGETDAGSDAAQDGPGSDIDGAETDAGSDAAQDSPDLSDGTIPDEIALPIVFVHGAAGSAQQYASQAMRFAANGYPQERIVAYDHDGQGFDVERFLPGLDEFVDATLEQFGVEQVYLVGHSRGTMTSSMYLSDPDRLAKVAKYISLDGGPCSADLTIPCINPNQAMLPGQKHVEVATSKECFEIQYEFLVGEAPRIVDIVNQSSPVVLKGRAVNFPANTAREGATLEFWEVDPETGRRTQDEPIDSFEIGADGFWGPVTVSPDKHYELLLYSLETGLYHHFYPQPFLRTSYLERLLSGPPDSPSRQNSNLGEGHTAITAMRMREWLPSDILEVSEESDSGDLDKINVITEDNVPPPAAASSIGIGEPIAIFLQDGAATPQQTTLELLPWFGDQFFQTGIDVYMPAADPPDGTITLTNMPRGDTSKPQTLVVPNWPSDVHTVMAVFSDFPQE